MTDLPRYVLIIPADGDPHGLLAPGAPVYSPRDLLEGWTVEGPIGTMVHAPTEGDGNVHPLNDGVWALRVIWDGAVVPEGVDRARRVLAADLNMDDGYGLQWRVHPGNVWVIDNGIDAVLFTRDPATLHEGNRVRVVGFGPSLPGDVPAPVALAQVLAARCGGRVEVSGG